MQNTKNLLEILSNTCRYNIFETHLSYWGCLTAVNLQIYFEISSPQTLCREKLGTSHDVKSFCQLAHFSRALLLK